MINKYLDCKMHFLLILFIGLAFQPEPPVTLDMRQKQVAEIVKEIEKQTNIHFSYESGLLEGLPKASLSVKGEPLSRCLDKLFGNLPVVYSIDGKYVILKRKPRRVTISGFIRDSTSSEPLIGASVHDLISSRGNTSNNYGFFSLTLNPGDVNLYVSYIGYKSRPVAFKALDRDTALIVELRPGVSLKEVVVTGSDPETEQVRNAQMGKLDINQRTIKATPVMFGESDIIKTLQQTPGVAVGSEGMAGMYVRGGNADENLFLIDGNPVYQVNHIGGVFSAFNAEAIRGMEFFKAGFPARYGGRLSSVIDLHTKEGNMKEYHGNASIGLISGNLSLEGPLIKDKTSFMIALRRTWLDVFTAPAVGIINKLNRKNGKKINARYAFHDLNLTLNHHFSDRSRMFFSLYNGNDVAKFKETYFGNDDGYAPYYNSDDASLRWGNMIATMGWTYVFNNKLFGKISGVYTRYRSRITKTNTDNVGDEGEGDYMESYDKTSAKTGITDFGIRSQFDYLPHSRHHIRFGADMMMHRFRPEQSKTYTHTKDRTDNNDLGVDYANDLLWAQELSAFAEDDWSPADKFRFNAGLRYNVFHIDSKTFSGIEPRLSARWLINDNLSLKASYARMRQNVHLVSDSYISLPTDAWMPVTRRLKPLLCDHYTLGAYYNWKNPLGEFEVSLEGYYKNLDHLLEYRDGYSFMPSFSSWEDKMAVGKGRAYGAELMVRKQTGRTTGWVGYALSWADRKFDELNDGQRFPAKYDNRHKLNIVVMHKLSKKVELSAAWTFASGNHFTLSLENYYGAVPTFGYNNYAYNPSSQSYYIPKHNYIILDHYDKRNNYQFPAYHRLDLGINIYRPKKKGRMGIWNISVYNVYCHMNTFLVKQSYKFTNSYNYESPVNSDYGYPTRPCFKKLGIIPIVPSVTYTFKF